MGTKLNADPVAIDGIYAAPFVLAVLPLFTGNNNPFEDQKTDEAPLSTDEAPASTDEAKASDLSIDYDAAARLAFEADENSGDDFEAFKAKYEKEAIDLVKSKQEARQK